MIKVFRNSNNFRNVNEHRSLGFHKNVDVNRFFSLWLLNIRFLGDVIFRELSILSGQEEGARGRVYHLSHRLFGYVAGDIDKSALSGLFISINHYNDPRAHSRQGSKYRC